MRVNYVNHAVGLLGQQTPVSAATALARAVVDQERFGSISNVVDLYGCGWEDLGLIIDGRPDDGCFS